MKALYSSIILILTISASLIAQTDTTKLVKYSPTFKYNEGFYLNFEQVKENAPVLKSRIVTDVKLTDLDYFEKVLLSKSIVFYDDYGVKQEVSVNNLWGYCRKGILYIQVENEFNRIPVVGSISHFVANITVYKDRMYNPYDNYYSYNSAMRPQQSSYELRQFILDFESGKVMEYNIQTLSMILMRDPVLYEEFSDLKKRKQKQMMFFYLRKYNERHPLYIPID